MAVTLRLHFAGAGGRKILLSFLNAKSNPAPADVKALMQGIITNKDIYVDAPNEIVKAELYNTDTTPITLPV